MTSDTDSPDIVDTLAQRGSVYGDFREQGRITQNLKRAMQDSPNWENLPSYMKEGLDMVQHKISRMLNGDALYDDNMHDIIGYTRLMQDRASQDRAAGLTVKSSGDKLYPVYKQEDKRPELELTAAEIISKPALGATTAAHPDPVQSYYAAKDEGTTNVA